MKRRSPILSVCPKSMVLSSWSTRRTQRAYTNPTAQAWLQSWVWVNVCLVQMGTLGKALGGFGAYVAGSKALRELLINRCRSFIFTTSLPPAVMAMAIAAINLIEKEPERRRALRDNCQRLRGGLESLGYSLGTEPEPNIAADDRGSDSVHEPIGEFVATRAICPGDPAADSSAGNVSLAHYPDGDA